MKIIIILLLSLFLLGSSSCPTEPKEEKTEEIGAPPGFPEVPPPPE